VVRRYGLFIVSNKEGALYILKITFSKIKKETISVFVTRRQ